MMSRPNTLVYCAMNESTVGALLRLESETAETVAGDVLDRRDLFVSVNPDLKTDFGHYLNYEKRLAEACSQLDLDYIGLASRELQVQHAGVLPAFEHDSGHYSMVRASASGREDAIAAEFRARLLDVLGPLRRTGRWRKMYVFMYCGSSRLALNLAELPWPEDLRVCINAFWDFLIEGMAPAQLSRLCFQRVVRLLAMSDLHAENWHAASGLRFDWIPNPPPLLGDAEAYGIVRQQVSSGGSRDRIRVLVPGLMTVGKGRETTAALLEYLRQHGAGDLEYIFRDRKSELGDDVPEHVQILSGNLSDEEVIQLYKSSDLVVLPYEAPIFAVRTSGALVDALVFGAVPLVLEGTWLAHQCRKQEVGLVLPNAQPATLVEAIVAVVANLDAERQRLPRAAALYLARNAWSTLVRRVVSRSADAVDCEAGESFSHAEPSLFAAANRMLRDERYAEAAQIYSWLATTSPLSVYQSNLQLCVKRNRRTIEQLLVSF